MGPATRSLEYCSLRLLGIVFLFTVVNCAVERVTIRVPPGKERCIQQFFREVGPQRINYTLLDVGSMANSATSDGRSAELLKVSIMRVLSGGKVFTSAKGQGSYTFEIKSAQNTYEAYKVCFSSYLDSNQGDLKFSLWLSRGVDLNDFSSIPLEVVTVPNIDSWKS